MPTFVVSLLLPESFEYEFAAPIPRHRNFTNGLLNEKVIEIYAIISDRSRGWVTINGADKAAVRAMVEHPALPVYAWRGN